MNQLALPGTSNTVQTSCKTDVTSYERKSLFSLVSFWPIVIHKRGS